MIRIVLGTSTIVTRRSPRPRGTWRLVQRLRQAIPAAVGPSVAFGTECLVVPNDDLSRSLLKSDREAWEQYGALPGEEHLAIYVDNVAEVADERDLVFLWLAFAVATCGADDDDDAIQDQFVLGELTERLEATAIRGRSWLDDLSDRALDRRSGRFQAGSFLLDDGTRIQLERSLLQDGRRLLAGRAYRPGAPGVEVVLLARGGWQIRTFDADAVLEPLLAT